jgi:hypothetical protein
MKTYKLNPENYEPTSIQPMKEVKNFPEDVIKVQFTKNESPTTLDVVTIQEVGTDSRVNQDLVVPTREQTDPKTIELIQKIKTLVASMGESEKELVHWKKRKFELALVVGEDLVTIRRTFGKNKGEFRKFVETEFSNEFCYKTAERYMKLFTNKKDIPPDVCNLRKAFVSLGILKEEYLDSDEKKENTSGNVVPTTPKQPKQGTTKEKNFISVKKQKLYDHPNSIILDHYRLDSDNELYQIVVNPDGRLFGINVEDYSRMAPTKPTFDDIVFERLKPFVEWYNIKNKEKEEKKKKIDFYSSTVDELDRAA